MRKSVVVEARVYGTRADGSRFLKYAPGDVIPMAEAVALGLVAEDGERKVRTAKTRAPRQERSK